MIVTSSMRFVYSLLAVTAVLSGYFIYKPEQFEVTKKVVAQSYEDALIRKKISIEGVNVLRSDRIQEVLPNDRSILWWNLNRSTIEALLEKNPYIQNAEVRSCSTVLFDWGCFVVSIEERLPAYLSLYGNNAVLLGEDGATIRTVDAQNLEDTLRRLLKPTAQPPKVLVGLLTPGASTDVTEARFRYLKSSINTIEDSATLRVERAELLQNGELSVRVSGKPFAVTFDDTSRDGERLKDEVKRLEKLLVELRGREDQVEKVDLAFNKMAVVSFRHAEK